MDSLGGKPGRGSKVTSSLPEVPVTVQRKVWEQPDNDVRIPQPGTARANLAATYDRPQGTTEEDWAERHKHQSALQQHLDFFDRDHDGIVWPADTYHTFRAIGFGIPFSLFSVVAIHGAMAYPTNATILPDLRFPIHLSRIHKDKHGSDTGAYDSEGRFVPQKFEEIFTKYAHGRDYMTLDDVWGLLRGQHVLGDHVGRGAAVLEWVTLYLMLWPEDGRMAKEDVRRVYDGSIFHVMAERQKKAGR
ncbi:hypothetical protein CDD83_11161 [Cordyceps sp. RAO-2017]|nr:hypothetical protein CDD83_11161 [Cordyceps sp. RAO-2017]